MDKIKRILDCYDWVSEYRLAFDWAEMALENGTPYITVLGYLMEVAQGMKLDRRENKREEN